MSRKLTPVGLRELAAQCRVEAKRPGVGSRTAIVLFLTANKLEESADRHLQQAAALERLEADRAP